jgi:hypothetical protein
MFGFSSSPLTTLFVVKDGEHQLLSFAQTLPEIDGLFRYGRLFRCNRSRSADRRSTCSNIFVITPAKTERSANSNKSSAIVFHRDPFPGSPIW